MVLMASWPARTPPQQGRLLPKLLVVAEGWLGKDRINPGGQAAEEQVGQVAKPAASERPPPWLSSLWRTVGGGELGTCGVHVRQPCPGHFSHLGNQTPSPDGEEGRNSVSECF